MITPEMISRQNINSATLLLSVNDVEEIRTIIFERSDSGTVVLTECCSGPLTEVIFGSAWHSCRIILTPQTQKAIIQMLGFSRYSVHQAFKRFFSDDTVFLSDLQDILDTAGLEYTSVVCNEDTIAYRASAA